MKSTLSTLLLIAITVACAPMKKDGPSLDSGLSSVTIGTFKPPFGKATWSKMGLTITSRTDAANVQRVNFDISSFKTGPDGKATNSSIKMPKGDYLFTAEYRDAADRIVYRSCNFDAIEAKHVEGKATSVKIVVCPIDGEVPAGSTDTEDTSVEIIPELASEAKACPAFEYGVKYRAGVIVSMQYSFFRALKDNENVNPRKNSTVFEEVNDCEGNPIPPPKPFPTNIPEPTPASDVTKGRLMVTVTCVICHKPAGPAASVTLNSSVIPRLDNPLKGDLKKYHLSLRLYFEGQNRIDLEAGLKTIK